MDPSDNPPPYSEPPPMYNEVIGASGVNHNGPPSAPSNQYMSKNDPPYPAGQNAGSYNPPYPVGQNAGSYNPPYPVGRSTGPYSPRYAAPVTFQPTHVSSVAVVTSVANVTPLGPDPATMVCPHCRASIRTHVKRSPTAAAYVSCFVISLFGCICGCCLIPFCIDSCRQSEHTCPNCQMFIGRYART